MLKKQMLPVLLAAVLLAGCAADEAPSTAQDAAQSTQDPGAAAQADTVPEAAEPSAVGPALYKLESFDEQGYYYDYDPDFAFCTQFYYADFSAGSAGPLCSEPGCAHDTADCPAVFQNEAGPAYAGLPYILDENTLIFFSTVWDADGDSSVSSLWTMDRRGESRTCIADNLFDGALSGVTSADMDKVYTDGQRLYWSGYRYADTSSGVFCYDLTSGETTEVARSESSSVFLLGCTGRRLAVLEYLSDTDSQTGQRLSLLDIDTGESEVLREYSPVPDSGELSPLYQISFAVLDGVLYEDDLDAGTLTATDLAAGTTRTVTDAMPPDPSEGRGRFFVTLARVLDGTLVAEYSSDGWENEDANDLTPVYLVDLETGEVREKPALPTQNWNGYDHTPTVLEQLDDRLLITTRAEAYNVSTFNTDGAPYAPPSEHRYFGLISYDDYLTGTPNYTELGRLY